LSGRHGRSGVGRPGVARGRASGKRLMMLYCTWQVRQMASTRRTGLMASKNATEATIPRLFPRL
jgi:hypothetical protein